MTHRLFSQFWKRKNLLVVLFLSVFLLGGCVAPLSIDTDIELPPDYHTNLDALEFDSVTINNEDLVQWWEQFEDPTLTELVNIAINNSKDIEIALARIEQARAIELGARASLLPQIGVGAASQRYTGLALTTGTEVVRQWQADLQASWEVDLFGAGRQRLAAARFQTEASITDVHAVRLSLVAIVASLYLDYRGMQQQSELLQESLEYAHEFLEIAQRNFLYGFAQQVDVRMAQADVSQVQAQLELTNTQISLLRFNLENLCMLSPGSLESLLSEHAPLPDIPAMISNNQPVDLLMRRPDLLAAQLRLQSAIAQGQAARRDYFPKLSLSGLLGFSGIRIGGVNQGTEDLWFAGISTLLPILDFGTRRAQVQLWDARTQEALLAYQQQAINALFDVERALLQLSRDQEILLTLTTQVQERQKILQLIYRQFEVGTVGRLDVVQSRIALLQSQMTLLAQDISRLQTQVALFRALGGGWETM